MALVNTNMDAVLREMGLVGKDDQERLVRLVRAINLASKVSYEYEDDEELAADLHALAMEIDEVRKSYLPRKSGYQ